MADFKLQSINQIASSLKGGKPESSNKVSESGMSFDQWLSRSIQDVSKLQEDADNSAIQLATGENKDIHGTMIKMQKAEVAMNLMVEVRNKVIAAYDEIKRMQL